MAASIDSEWLDRVIKWSKETFGPEKRTGGVIAHIRKELEEVESDPDDIREWIDVAILAFDGAWRHGATSQEIIDTFIAKQKTNMERSWPNWRGVPDDKPIEHNK